MVNILATRVQELLAGVPFYGGAPTAEDVEEHQSRDADHHGATTSASSTGGPPTKPRSRPTNVQPRGLHLCRTQHGFNNDTTPRYDAAAAKLAWERTIAHFNKYVRG